MCGIVGYVGKKDCTKVLLDSLSKLEYRGYDSAGIAVFENDAIKTKKTPAITAICYPDPSSVFFLKIH